MIFIAFILGHGMGIAFLIFYVLSLRSFLSLLRLVKMLNVQKVNSFHEKKSHYHSYFEKLYHKYFGKLLAVFLLFIVSVTTHAQEASSLLSKPPIARHEILMHPENESVHSQYVSHRSGEGRQSPFQNAEVRTIDTKMWIQMSKDEQHSSDVPIMTGQRISLDVKEAPVREVLTRLAALRQVNIVLSDKIDGNMTVQLKGVTWEQALDVILMSRSLGKQFYKDVLLVAPIEELIERSQKAWQSKEEVNKRQSLHTALFQIHHGKANDLALLIRDKSNTLLSEKGGVAVDLRSNTLMVQDNAVQLERIKKLIHHLDVPLRQVLIEARIVNVTKEFARDLGLRFGVSKPSPLSEKPGQSSGKSERDHASKGHELGSMRDITDHLNLDLATIPLAASSASVGIALAKLGAGILLDLELSALESEGQGKVVSSPHLITLNQQMAVIEAGEEIPYQELTPHGATAVAFKKAVLSLKVTPHITPDRKIYMDLKINQDIPSPKVLNGVPTILTKEIQTNVLVNDNETIVLGGIYKQNHNHEVNRVPWLGDLPIIKMLFRNQSKRVRNEELLIFITPRVLKGQHTIR